MELEAKDMAGRRGRTAGFKMPEEHRSKIANSSVLNRLIALGEGRIKMTQAEVTACIALIRKILPDLTATQLSGDADKPLTTKIERVIVGAAEKPVQRLSDEPMSDSAKLN